MQSKAVVFTAPNTVSVESVSCPDPGPDDVVVRITHSWISNGTEGSYLRGERSDGDTPFLPGDRSPFPVVAGYQKVGVIEWLGKSVHGFSVGETVFATIGRVEGMHHWYAGHVSPSVCPASEVRKLPPGVDPLAFAGLVLTQVGYNAGSRPRLEPGDLALVFGDGMVGHWSAQTLAWRGAEVIMAGKHDERLAFFEGRPFHHTVNVTGRDWRDYVRSSFGERRLQVVVDTIGDTRLFTWALPLMRRFGHLVSAGFYGTGDLLALQPPRYGEHTIDLISGWTGERLDETLNLVAGGYLETLPLITHRFPVENAAEAWNLIESKKKFVLGVILEW